MDILFIKLGLSVLITKFKLWSLVQTKKAMSKMIRLRCSDELAPSIGTSISPKFPLAVTPFHRANPKHEPTPETIFRYGQFVTFIAKMCLHLFAIFVSCLEWKQGDSSALLWPEKQAAIP